MIPLVALAVFMLLGGVVFKWDPTRAKYEVKGSN